MFHSTDEVPFRRRSTDNSPRRRWKRGSPRPQPSSGTKSRHHWPGHKTTGRVGDRSAGAGSRWLASCLSCVRRQRVQTRALVGVPLTSIRRGWRFGCMRRWARTRFIPDDCGLKPPIETLPQSAQERAMRGPQLLVGRKSSPERAERSGRIAHGLRDPARTPPTRSPSGGRRPRVDDRNARPQPRDATRRHRHRPGHDPELLWRHGVRGEPRRASAWPARVRTARHRCPACRRALDRPRSDCRLWRPDRGGRAPGRFGSPLRHPARSRPRGGRSDDPRRRRRVHASHSRATGTDPPRRRPRSMPETSATAGPTSPDGPSRV